MENTKYKTDLTERAYAFGLSVIKLTNSLPNKRSAWVITDQLIRSACSIGANLTEGKAASSRLEYKKFYEISLKSANESKYWLMLLVDSELVQLNNVSNMIGEIDELCKMLASGVLRLKGKKL